MNSQTEKPQHDLRDSSGRYKKTHACDGCGKPVGTDHMTDDEVCAGGDGPGFFLCDRKRCPTNNATFQNKPVAERLAFYTATRTAARAVSR